MSFLPSLNCNRLYVPHRCCDESGWDGIGCTPRCSTVYYIEMISGWASQTHGNFHIFTLAGTQRRKHLDQETFIRIHSPRTKRRPIAHRNTATRLRCGYNLFIVQFRKWPIRPFAASQRIKELYLQLPERP